MGVLRHENTPRGGKRPVNDRAAIERKKKATRVA